jgi:hypothetical protein
MVPLGHIVQPVDPAKGAIEAVHGLQYALEDTVGT